MRKCVLISIRPEWCTMIASGKKTIEVRKTRPKLETPFKCYIYETKGKVERPRGDEDGYIYQEGRGAVVGEFVCDRIFPIQLTEEGYDYESEKETRLRYEEMSSYLNFRNGYGWHISDLVIYGQLKELREFKQCHKCEYHKNCFEHEYSCDGTYALSRPPQSWCYVEET